MCGENSLAGQCALALQGSPPRVRGKRRPGRRGPCGVRLTPACAGKTRDLRYSATQTGAHPRVCGENTYWPPLQPRDQGSPPRVRGKRQRQLGRVPEGRLTPACAGKTRWRRPTSSPRWAHPRVCGENGQRLGRETAAGGSPPRVRGKRPAHESLRLLPRLTPACAGKTVLELGGGDLLAAHPRVCGENVDPSAGEGGHVGSPPRVRGKPRGLVHPFR